MDDKLTLGHPNVEAALAPSRRFAEREEKRRNRSLMLMPFFAFTALGAIFGRSQPDEAYEAEPEATDATPQEQPKRADLDVIADVAAYLRTVSAEIAATGEDQALGSVRLSFRSSLSSDLDPLYSSVSKRSVIANDNQLSVRDDDGRFTFPSIGLPSSGPGVRFPPANDYEPGTRPVTPGYDDDDTPGGNGSGTPGGGNSGGTTGPGNGGGSNTGGGNTGGGNTGGNADDEDDGSGGRQNRAPVSLGRHMLGVGLMDLSVLIMLNDIIALMRDADGDALTVGQITVSSGEVRAYGQDMWLYTPERGYLGNVTFSYGVSDGKATTDATALLSLIKAPPREIRGTEGDDSLVGTPHPDIIEALGGNDIVYGREDDDIISGGEGNDRLLGGSGNDVIYGGTGHDYIAGGAGNDILFGGDGDDVLLGEDGDDVLIAGAGDDTLDGGTGDDRLFGEDGDDDLAGSAGNDILDGGAGNDVLTGGSGNDVVAGGAGDDVLLAGFKGEESRTDAPVTGDGDDHYSGGEGFDTYDASSATMPVTVNLEQGRASSTETGSDTLESIEAVVGGSGNDTITGNDGDNRLEGAAGNDILTPLGGNDVVLAGAGDDVIIVAVARVGQDDDGDDILDGGEGFDTYDASHATKTVVIDLENGTACGEEIGADTLTSFEAAIGGASADIIYAGLDVNFLAGSGGADIFVFRTLESIRNGGLGRDEIKDFEVGDRIDLSDIAENLGGLAFGDDDDRPEINRIRFYHEGFDDDQRTIVRMVIDFEHDEDIEILLHGRHELSAQDFILAAREEADRDTPAV